MGRRKLSKQAKQRKFDVEKTISRIKEEKEMKFEYDFMDSVGMEDIEETVDRNGSIGGTGEI